MNQKIKAVIFDLNGVFLKSEPLSLRLEEKYGVNVDSLLPILKMALKSARLPNANPDIWLPLTNLLKISKDQLFDFWFSGESVDTDLLKYANELKNAQYKVMVLSNNFRERTNYYRQHFPEIFNCINKSYFSWETGFVKPDISAFELLLKENNLKPNECIYFDDSEENVKIAQNIGINSFIYVDLEETRKIISGFA